MSLRLLLVALLLSSAPLHARDYQAGKLFLEQPMARPTRPGQPSGAVYVNIENRGGTADRLLGASSPVAGRTEIHAMTMDGNVMRMREIGEIALDAGATLSMRPGAGHHLMLLQLKKPLKAGESFPLTLRFEKAGKVEVSVEISDQIGAGHQHGTAGHEHGHTQ